MKRFYCFITDLLESNLLSILLGLISGFGINIISGSRGNKDYLLAVGFCLTGVIALFVLIRIRQLIDDEFKKRAKDPINREEKWEISSGVNVPGRVGIYNISFFLFLISVVSMVYFYKKGASNEKEATLFEKEEMNRKLNVIDSLNKVNNAALYQLQTTLDSLSR